MEEDKLDWWLFDKEQCWRDLHDLRTSWELRNGLMHTSWTREGNKVGGGETGFESVLGLDIGEGWTSWNTSE